jgi:uncharacterized protein (DUF2235 family)
MGKNIVICCDGTNNQFGENNTNVVRLVQSAKRDFCTQHVYYDPGVGTLPEPGWVSWAGGKISDIAGLAFGAGLDWKVQQAYSYLMDWWEPGDRVYLFGFSRGSYSVRVLAGFLHELGLLAHGSDNMVPYAMRLFKTARDDRKHNVKKESSLNWGLRDQFRETFARPVPDSPDRRFPIHFMGLFDTVSSVGWAWDPAKYPFTTHNPSVKVVRHAVSIDERRWFFRQNLVGPVPGQDLQQQWFPGVHCDVGGGYPEKDGGIWRSSFEWIIEHARLHGMEIDEADLSKVLTKSAPPSRPWDECQHESLQGAWWLLEYFPKLCPRPGQKPVPGIGAGRHRTIAPGQNISRAALLRLREKPDYRPPNLSAGFRAKVIALTDVPEYLEYMP